MIRKAFLMALRPGCQDEYEQRHNPIWPELQDVLKDHGVRNHSIFLDRGRDRLFAYLELESEQLWHQTSEIEICRRWWSYMKDLMVTNPDNSPVTVDPDEVFHLD